MIFGTRTAMQKMARYFVLFSLVLAPMSLWASDAATLVTPAPNDLDVPAKAPVEKSVQELAATVKKSVVVVTFTGRDGQRQGLGTGFIVSEDGLIATNLHVIGEARPIRVELLDGRKFDVAAVHATERFHDLALLKIDATDLPALPLGNSDELQEGQPVVAIGNPLGLERSVVSGVLSGRREIDGRSMLQIALPIERGNSGGPLLDLQGHVHGLLTMKSLKSENLGFAIAVNALKPLLEKPNPVPMSRWLTIGAMDPAEWTVLPGGRWRQRAGQIVVDGMGGGFGGRALCLATEPTPPVPYEVAVQVKFSPDDGAAGLVFNADGSDRHYGFYPSNGGLRLSRFDGPDVFSWAVLRETRSPHFKKEGWNSLKVRVEAERTLCYINGELIFETTDSAYKSGRVGLCKFRQTEAQFKGFRVGESLSEPRISTELLTRVTSTLDALPADDESKARVVRELAREDSSVIDILDEQVKALESRVSQLKRLASDIHLTRTLADFHAATAAEPVDLLRGALLIAKLDNPELEIENYVADVERHARQIKEGLQADASEDQRLAALNRYLFEEQGFHGSRTDYDNRSNSYVNEVLDDREGLPITLSVLYIEIAKRVGLNVVGVGMPRHFLVRHEPREGSSQLVDVFERGLLLTPAEAQNKFEALSDVPWRDSYLDTTTPKAILERILRNLFSNAADEQEIDRMIRYTDAILVLSPNSGQDHFYRGVLSFQARRWHDARAEVEWLMTNDSNVSRTEVERLSQAIESESQK
ncbi:transglutaminase family protein [Schlesneria sp.]|uniref:transglutaminase family protein n=1 Tax=Schlesneria sp. TaxID=2762018 RepID=UPI002EE4BEB6